MLGQTLLASSGVKLLTSKYVERAQESERCRSKRWRQLVEERRIPDQGWSSQEVEAFLLTVSLLDTNNEKETVGVGEREGRVFSSIVARRHFGFSHGVGRSGDVAAPQPKAVGSSLLGSLAQSLAGDFIRRVIGMEEALGCLVLPVATSLALSLCLLSIRLKHNSAKNTVLISRIDQKACFKAVITAGFEAVVFEQINTSNNYPLGTDVESFREYLERHADSGTIAAIISTTSCFAPRQPDDVRALAKLAARYSIAHIVNNAYGLQCRSCVNSIREAMRNGRVDFVVQSTDKNFMVPVGGSLVVGPDSDVIGQLAKDYPGRASSAPSTDLLITMLEMGKEGWQSLVGKRMELFQDFRESMEALAVRFGSHLIPSSENFISIAMDISFLIDADANINRLTQLGALLFSKKCTGHRVVTPGTTNDVCGHSFKNYGAHSSKYGVPPYLTVACAIGATKEELNIFIDRLNKALGKLVEKTI